jgi:amidophosphoribosyltransferase
MIGEVFRPNILDVYSHTHASQWLLQTRYGTDGDTHINNVQPIISRHKTLGDYAFVVNGQFSDVDGESGNHKSDSVIFAQQLNELDEGSWDANILHMQQSKQGAWSMAISTGEGLYLMRDPHGIRPLAYGKTNDIWVAASETAALKAMGITHFTEIRPGSVVKISENRVITLREGDSPQTFQAACIFENIYIADGRSTIHAPRGNSEEVNASKDINHFRKECGTILAYEAPLSGEDVDIAIGVPGTGIAGGRSFAEALALPYMQAISDRNPQEDPRTFMTPDIDTIYQKALEHFYLDESKLRGMRVVLIDDSMVRGNITKALVQLLKEKYGVRSVHIRILCPPIDKGCHLGINTRSRQELIAARHNGDISKIKEEIGADSLAFLSDKGMLEATGKSDGFCMGCMVNHQPPMNKQGEIIFREN